MPERAEREEVGGGGGGERGERRSEGCGWQGRAPGLIFLRPATQISTRLVHHSCCANTSVAVTLVLFCICGHTHTFAGKRELLRCAGGHSLSLINVHQHALETRVRITHTGLIISFLFPVAAVRPAAPLQPPPPSSLPGSDREIEGVINSELRGWSPSHLWLSPPSPPPLLSICPPLTSDFHTVRHLFLLCLSRRLPLCARGALKWCRGWFKGEICTFHYYYLEIINNLLLFPLWPWCKFFPFLGQSASMT